MKFMFFFYPAIPASMEEREALRPIAARNDRFQQMLDEIVELSQMAEDLGFTAVAFPEHHLHTEGGEMGSLPVLTQHVLANTKKFSPVPSAMFYPAGTRCAWRWKQPGWIKYRRVGLLPVSRAAINHAG